ncbi:hypothetical protein [Thermaerobacter subterraneus]|uniref:Uncharacterized protein n=1 Tax=Thermaerobacter subterraneus DSM 13965 TaxID=867903 RepID=K6PSC3_9FIRM|nr:hypothetical protein [Thermaerobacter subterraneus]EKP95867.1 hypothetical protein ThesuDRAFT_01628 [Thermaerobacter subterraneus DSM 13965]
MKSPDRPESPAQQGPAGEAPIPKPGALRREPHFQQPAVLASFRDPDGAQRAAEALKAAGYRHVQIDRLQPVREERGNQWDQPVPDTLTGAMDRDRRALAAMSPTVSGWSDDELVGDMPYLLTVPLEPGQSRDQAAAIVRQHGGRV